VTTILNRFCAERCPGNVENNYCSIIEKTNKCPVEEFVKYLKALLRRRDY